MCLWSRTTWIRKTAGWSNVRKRRVWFTEQDFSSMVLNRTTTSHSESEGESSSQSHESAWLKSSSCGCRSHHWNAPVIFLFVFSWSCLFLNVCRNRNLLRSHRVTVNIMSCSVFVFSNTETSSCATMTRPCVKPDLQKHKHNPALRLVPATDRSWKLLCSRKTSVSESME